jgi:hypothetical protein
MPVIGTLVAVNLMLFALILGKNVVPIQEAIPSVAQPAKPELNTDFQMEKVGEQAVPGTPDISIQMGNRGYWTVEHYKEYEYHYDGDGHLLYKEPTSNDTYLRYWHETK